MSDLRNRIEVLSPAEKMDLLDVLWESLDADGVPLTDISVRSWINALRGSKAAALISASIPC